MAQNASDVLVDILMSWGVEVVFGLPGDGINGVIEALRQKKDKLRFIQVRHEEAAAFMACGYAKYTGKLGVCLATSGPGGIHLLNGLYDAKMDGAPVLAITGMQYNDLLETHTQQDVELDKLYMDVAVYNSRVMSAAHMENVASLACRTALARRGVAHITIPVDVQSAPVNAKERSKRNIAHHVSETHGSSFRIPEQKDLAKAAEILNSGKRIAILVGQGALHAAQEVERVAELLQAPVIKALMGKAVLPDDSPYTTGSVGLLGTKPSQEAIEQCDTFFIIGSSFPYIEFLPKPGQAQCVQIDIDPIRIGLRYPCGGPLVGDSAATLRALLPLIKPNLYRKFLQQAQEGMKEWWKLQEERGTRKDKPMKPQVLAWELGKRLKDDAITSCDSGTGATWWARQIKSRRGQKHTLSGTLATMACGLPYAIAAQIAYPGRQVVAFVGDGAFTMLMGELLTCVKYKLPVKIVILKNNTLGQIKWEQMVFLGNPEYGVELQPMDFALFAKACGARGFSIKDPADCGAVLDEALAAEGPVVIEAEVDPFEPPQPAKIKASQAAHFAEALLRGEPNREKIALTVLSDTVREMI